jgi:hypothetical protein
MQVTTAHHPWQHLLIQDGPSLACDEGLSLQRDTFTICVDLAVKSQESNRSLLGLNFKPEDQQLSEEHRL